MSQTKLHIGEGLLLPKDVVTATTVVYGGKGMGKTNFGSVLVEELTKVSQRWAVLDPMGVWWGLRHSKDGKGAGIPCLILGGPHGDIPIEPTGGTVVADLVADEDVNVIIDFSRKGNGEAWGVGEKIRFVTDYGKRLFQRQSSLVNGRRREPLLQIMDEAARFIPQMIRAGQPELAMCLSVWAQIVEEGRNSGLGVVLLTQRSARLNKDVAELADAMLAFRTVGPNSIEAVTDWLGEHVPKAHINEIIEKLRSLPRGTCLVVSPGWLQLEAVLAVRERETFDSSATPKPGESARRVTGKGATPDLGKYAERMKETIEKAKADDPKELRRTIAELQKQLTQRPAQPKVSVQEKTNPAQQQIIVALKGALEAAMKVIAKITAFGFEQTKVNPKQLEQAVQKAVDEIGRQIAVGSDIQRKEFEQLKREANALLARLEKVIDKKLNISVDVVRAQPPFVLGPSRQTISPANGNGSGEVGGVGQNILNQLAELEALGIVKPEKAQVALMAGYTNARSGGFTEPLAGLLQDGFVIYPTPGFVQLTDAGRQKAITQEKPLTTKELHDRLCQKLGGAEGNILRELIAAYPDSLSKEELASKLNYSNPRSGGFTEPLGRLRALGIAEYPQPKIAKAADWLFIEGAA